MILWRMCSPGTRGCIALGTAIFGTNRSLQFIDLRSNDIQNQAMYVCGEVLRKRLDRGSCGELGGNRPPPALVTFDVQRNRIGGYGVSAELPGLTEFLDGMNEMVSCRSTPKDNDGISVFLSGNAIRPKMARNMVAKFTGTRLKLFVDVRQ